MGSKLLRRKKSCKRAAREYRLACRSTLSQLITLRRSNEVTNRAGHPATSLHRINFSLSLRWVRWKKQSTCTTTLLARTRSTSTWSKVKVAVTASHCGTLTRQTRQAAKRLTQTTSSTVVASTASPSLTSILSVCAIISLSTTSRLTSPLRTSILFSQSWPKTFEAPWTRPSCRSLKLTT